MANIDGTNGNDNLTGTAGDDTINGFDGNDELSGLEGDDELSGGSGNDELNGGPGNDELFGKHNGSGDDDGDDTLNGGPGDDFLSGDIGVDTLNGNADDDTLWGGPGDDELNGNAGDDWLQGDSGSDTLDGGPGADWGSYRFSAAGVTIDLSAAPDANGFVSGAGGHAEGDKLKNIEHLYGSDHRDRLNGDDNNNVILGRGGDDSLRGGPGDDNLYGNDGHDWIIGGDGADTLYGGSGNDSLFGQNNSGPSPGDEENILYGGPGDDWLFSGPGLNTLDGDPGHDHIVASSRNIDTVNGGDGFDLVDYHTVPIKAEAGVTIDLSAAPDAEGYHRGAGGDAQGDKLKNIEGLWGSAHGDRLTGDDNDNMLFSFEGDDTLHGNGGNDRLSGGAGEDMLDGGPGDDQLYGDHWLSDSTGADRFVFGADSGNDTIEDFEPDSDKIQFSESGITFADLRIEANGGSARVNWGDAGQSITLTDIADTALTEGSFLFGEDASVFTGTAGNDTLTGTTGVDTINGLAGDDTLDGGNGADMLDGGPGSDTASYENSAVAVLVRLHDARAVKFGDAEGDTLTGIEHIIGSRYNDILAGDGEDNILKGKMVTMYCMAGLPVEMT